MKKQFFCFFYLIFSTLLTGMESNRALQPVNLSPKTSPIKEKKKIRLTSNFKENYPELVQNTYENRNYNTYAAEQFVYNQDAAIKSMNAATKRGASTYLTVGKHSQNKPDQYQVTQFKRDPHIHGKLTVGLDSSPTKQKPQKGTLLFGSANTTNSTWKHRPNQPGAQFNFESGLEITDDMDLITDAYKMVKSQSPIKPQSQKITIQNSPEKSKIYSSKDTDLNSSLALRLQNARKVSARTMTFNDPNLANAISALGQNAEIIVDSSALTKKGIPLLQQMYDAQANVHVFYPPKGSHAKQHAKDLIIEKEDKKSYISSTANMTNEGNTQRNYQLYVPNNEQVISDAQEDFEKVKKSTISFPKALELKEQELKRKKLEKTQEKTYLKKQKLNK